MLQQVIERLTADGIDASLSSKADPSLADTAATMAELLEQLVPGHAYPLTLPEKEPLPNAVYQPMARNFLDADGYLLGRVDIYMVTLRAARFGDIQQLTQQLDQAVSAFTGVESIEITDAAQEYESDQQQYQAHFEIQIATLSTDTPSLPAAFVHTVGSDAAPPRTTCRHQLVTESLAVVLIATQSDIEALRLRAVSALVGLESPGAITPLEDVGGQQVAVSGRHVYWRELLQWQRRIPT
ncbi:hypothetical protein QO259_17100 [Salinicola sp. JS01]|uniref:hypothetical protein n=1 Tax=Salinicola sp. JS01 TaxID=3050071 RepID=UPI00255C0AE9|nr:hypothetical protein [Salinicola sp. JS01]WIX32505.1 hypothetical protein QO259_17100 [Salinicola sp. JS01]